MNWDHPSDRLTLEQAKERGYDPSDPQDLLPRRPLSPEEQAEFDASPIGVAFNAATAEQRARELDMRWERPA